MTNKEFKVKLAVTDLYLEYYKMSNDGKKTLEQLTELVGLQVPRESKDYN